MKVSKDNQPPSRHFELNPLKCLLRSLENLVNPPPYSTGGRSRGKIYFLLSVVDQTATTLQRMLYIRKMDIQTNILLLYINGYFQISCTHLTNQTIHGGQINFPLTLPQKKNSQQGLEILPSNFSNTQPLKPCDGHKRENIFIS